VDIVDPYRIRFVLHTPWPDFLVFYATPATGAAWIVPKKYIEKAGEEGFRRQPVGRGPYRFAGMTPGVELVLEANEQYWRKRPSVKRVVIKSVPDRTTRLAMLKAGEADIAYVSQGVGEQIVGHAPIYGRNWEGHPCCSNIRASDPTFTRPPTSPPPPPSAAT